MNYYICKYYIGQNIQVYHYTTDEDLYGATKEISEKLGLPIKEIRKVTKKEYLKTIDN